MKKFRIFCFFLVALLFASCATILGNIKVHVKVPDENAIVVVNGQVMDVEKGLTVKKHKPLLVTTYKKGFKPRSMFFDDVHPDLGLLLDFAAIGLGVKLQEPGFLIYAGMATLTDLSSSAGRIMRNYKVLPMDSVFKNSIPGFNLLPFPGLDQVAADSLTIEIYKNYGNYSSSVPNPSKVWSGFKEDQTFDLYEWMDWQTEEMNLIGLDPAIITSFNKTIFLDVDIPILTIHEVENTACAAEAQFNLFFCDRYGNRLDSIRASGTSQLFHLRDWGYTRALTDALYESLIVAFNSPKFADISEGIQMRYDSLYSYPEELVLSAPSPQPFASKEFLDAQVTIKIESGEEISYNSGCMISSEGHLLTSYKLVGNKERIPVVFSNGATKMAKVVRRDAVSNAVIFKVDTIGNSAIVIDSTQEFKVGEDVFVLGTPVDLKLSQTLTSGIISSLKEVNGINYIQTDAKISAGDNGSPLVNEDGRLIGLVNEKFIGYGVEGISFAVSGADIVKRLNIRYNTHN